ncbi:MAG: hypothetical protein COB53_13290 [Elusimicrobia bacterium]|nr:MAG: hypothetical protein COB53_13290 [Elusimicrobiota bacterium]
MSEANGSGESSDAKELGARNLGSPAPIVETDKVTCGLCQFVFDEQAGRSSCGGCFSGGCGMVKCPSCGFETPLAKTPGWLKALTGFFSGAKA